MVDETTPTTIGARAKAVRLELHLQQQGIADELGISLRAWAKMERDEGTPSGETLLQFEKVGINPGWVLTGVGPKRIHQDESYLYEKNAIIDGDLLVDIKRVVAKVHQEVGITLRAEDLDRKAISHYNEYMLADTDLSDAEEMQLWLGLLEKRIRREATAARNEPGTGKREAS
ncbi:helix-turn-helix domain-containing protein [Mycoplana dimorpha]|uniref:Helix-turn-helix protein n=1 Tax=Mycoplana dimorpha TaxID=28320 RepID=A0A2T5B1P0_MYCDI|nr:helix-turn-helix domain-containing protein [Mycoplana dimorpha]PTM92854.1 helix-turn-helix protein [Mycoplana dimorpha]